MRGRCLFLALPALLAAGPAVPDPVDALAGRYSSHFRNGLVDGTSYWSDDILEIVPVDAAHAYVRVETNFFNGHMCSLNGVAAAEGNTLVYRDPAPADAYSPKCVLTVRRAGAMLSFDDGDGGCKRYCGARGGFGDMHLPWASRRPITYLGRLKASSQYRDALSRWRTGKPVP